MLLVTNTDAKTCLTDIGLSLQWDPLLLMSVMTEPSVVFTTASKKNPGFIQSCEHSEFSSTRRQWGGRQRVLFAMLGVADITLRYTSP